MAAFWVRYLLTAVLGATVIWHGVPELRARLEIRRATAAPAESSVAPRTSGAVPSGLWGEASDAAFSAEGGAALALPVRFSGAAVDFSVPPATAPGADGTNFDWGVLAETTPCYASSGTATGRLPGGTVIEKISVHTSSRGPMLRCRVLEGAIWRSDVFVPESAVVVFAGPYAEAPPVERDEVVRFLALKARIEDRRAELKGKALRANPHFEAYRAAAKALTAFQSESKALIERRDKVSGAERARLDDELRRMKFRAAALEREFDRVGEDYKRWRSQHDDGSQAAAADELIQRWSREYAALEPVLRDRIQGL